MEQDYSKVKVGDTVWWTDVNRSGFSEGKVTKVGTKLITAGFRVFRKDTGKTDDDYGHQFLIVDKEAYLAEKLADKAMWRLYQAMLHGYRQPGVTLADIEEAARILKIDIKGE